MFDIREYTICAAWQYHPCFLLIKYTSPLTCEDIFDLNEIKYSISFPGSIII
jgi:hypothetical protein